jgi:hypothetical protein
MMHPGCRHVADLWSTAEEPKADADAPAMRVAMHGTNTRAQFGLARVSAMVRLDTRRQRTTQRP